VNKAGHGGEYCVSRNFMTSPVHLAFLESRHLEDQERGGRIRCIFTE